MKMEEDILEPSECQRNIIGLTEKKFLKHGDWRRTF